MDLGRWNGLMESNSTGWVNNPTGERPGEGQMVTNRCNDPLKLGQWIAK